MVCVQSVWLKSKDYLYVAWEVKPKGKRPIKCLLVLIIAVGSLEQLMLMYMSGDAFLSAHGFSILD